MSLNNFRVLRKNLIPYSVESLSNLLECSGWINPSSSDGQRIFCYIQHSLLIFYITAHFYSTITRSVRNFPEFVQKLNEDAMVMMCYTTTQVLYHYTGKLTDLIAFIKSFSPVDKSLSLRAEKVSPLISLFFMTLTILIISTVVLETFYPFSDEELRTMAYVYRTENPGRKLPLTVRLPFVDETKTPFYEALYAWEIYLLIAIVPPCTATAVLLPLITKQLQVRIVNTLSRYNMRKFFEVKPS